jgi:cardiolipin synthase
VLEPVEARLMLLGGISLLLLAALFAYFPAVLVYPVVVVFTWFAIALLYRGYKLHRDKS